MTGKSLKILRITKEIPQWRLAQKVGITQAYLSAIETEKFLLTDEMEYQLKKAINEWKSE